MINLFEYQNKEKFYNYFEKLEEFLDEIWKNREKSGFYFGEQTEKIEVQQFIQFLHKTKELKSNKYVGVIHFEGQKINLLPKIFYDPAVQYSEIEINFIQNNILWWLSYCRKIKFPKYQTSLGSLKSDFFEVLIFLFSKYTRELLKNVIYQQYEEINEELSYIKGHINTNVYFNENITKARWHKINCTYDAFVLDNKFNRIIKYVTNLLLKTTSNSENKKYLREILFILDEVSDIIATAEDCKNIRFNPLFVEFETVRDYCFLFLNNCISFNYKNDLKLFAFLLPMEYLFEDFIFGFIDKEIEEVNAKAQISPICLDMEKKFTLRPDLLLEIGSKQILADTKYKIVYSDEKDPKKGIAQGDLYQMLAYAVRYKIDDIILFYPNTIKRYQEKISEVLIKDEFANKIITIKSFQLPIINEKLFTQDFVNNVELSVMFLETKENLKAKIEEILFPEKVIIAK